MPIAAAGLQSKLQQVNLYTPVQQFRTMLTWTLCPAAELDRALLTCRANKFAGAGSWYGVRGSKTLAHPDYDCITRWWHPRKNGASRPADFTYGSGKRVWLHCNGCPRCGEVHEWDAMVNTLTSSKAAHGIVCPSEDFAAAALSQQTAGCCRSGTRITQTRPQLLWAALGRSTSGGAQQAGGTQTMRPGQTVAVCLAVAVLLALQSNKGKLGHGSLAEQRPDLAGEWDAARNGGPPGQLTCGSGVRAWWKCSQCGHSWQARVGDRAAKGNGCPKCLPNNRMKPRKLTRAGLVGAEWE